MKKYISFVLIIALMILSSSCGNKKRETSNQSKKQNINYAISENLGEVQITEKDYNEFLTYIDYDGNVCPYSELFHFDEAMQLKKEHNLSPQSHSCDFFEGTNVANAEKLSEVVKKNNDAFRVDFNKNMYDELPNDVFEKTIQIICDTVNWLIETTPGIDMGILSCALGDLKVLYKPSPNYGEYNMNKGIMSINESIIKSTAKKEGVSFEEYLTYLVSHETVHLVQGYCKDSVIDENSVFYGTSHKFLKDGINPFYHLWLEEGVAELLAAKYNNIDPRTYKYNIDNINTIELAFAINGNSPGNSIIKASVSKNEDSLYSMFGFADSTKAMEFLYAVELLRTAPEEFKKEYENAHGTLSEDYKEFIKKTYNPYFIEVTSELLYKNLALRLKENKISINDVYYIISLYELDLLKSFPLNLSDIRSKYEETCNKYIGMRNKFFELMQNNTEADIKAGFQSYSMNYTSDSAIYADAELSWMDSENRDYLLNRNISLYSGSNNKILE